MTDGTIAAVAGLALLILPDGTGRRLLTWREANGAPWDVMLMFGGGLALAMGMTESGLAVWLGKMLLPLAAVPLIVVALVVVAFVVVDHRIRQQYRHSQRDHAGCGGAGHRVRRRPDPAGAARRPGRQPRLDAALGQRSQRHRLVNRACRPATGCSRPGSCSMSQGCS